MRLFAKKVITVTVAAAIAVSSLVGCANSSSSKVQKIGILQIVEHPALDSARMGFIDGLAEAGYVNDENITIDYQNAQDDQSNLKIMSQRLVQNKSDLILAIATSSAQSLAMETSEIPILITAVTDPKEAGIINDYAKPGTNVSGTSDLTPVKKQFELIKKVLPNAKKVGIMYTSKEVNSEIQAKIAIEAAIENGFEYEVSTVAVANDLAQVFSTLASKVDVVYVPTDNTIASYYSLLSELALDSKTPFVGAEEAAVEAGGLMTEGLNYYNLGKQTASMAVKVLKGEMKPQDMPIEYLEETNVVINMTTAEKLGIEIPASVLENAREIS